MRRWSLVSKRPTISLGWNATDVSAIKAPAVPLRLPRGARKGSESVNTLAVRLGSFLRRCNPMWQERRYFEALELVVESERRAMDGQRRARDAEGERDKLRADLRNVADRAHSRHYETAPDRTAYCIRIMLNPWEMDYGGLSREGRSVVADHIGHMVASEVSRSRFVAPPPTYSPSPRVVDWKAGAP